MCSSGLVCLLAIRYSMRATSRASISFLILPKETRAALTRVVTDCAEQGCALSKTILQETGKEIAELVLTAVRASKIDTPSVAVNGGVTNFFRFWQDSFLHKLRTLEMNELFNWDIFLQPYELAVEDFILKMEGIKNQYHKANLYCPIEIVSGRVKSPQGILDKARRMNVPTELIDEKVHDIAGIRITCKYIDDVYKVAELVKNRRDLEVLEVRDYIKNVKPSGYRSFHIIARYSVETIKGAIPVLLEFQIRTHAMHFWASIEHSLKYKYQKRIPVELKERLTAAAKAAEKLDEEMTSIKLTIEKLDFTFGEDKSKQPDPLESEVTINHKKW